MSVEAIYRKKQQAPVDAAVKTWPKSPRSRELEGRKVLIIVENLPVPFDRRVWQQARTLQKEGASVSIICPVGKGAETRYEYLEGIHIYRHPQFPDAQGALGYLLEYSTALYWETVLAWKIWRKHGFDTLHGCNPPDLIFLIAWQFKLLGKKYIFDHHDINPELYEAKFGRRGLFWRALCLFEWLTFKAADVVISTNESYRKIAIDRGGKDPDKVYIVRSGPDLSRVKPVEPNALLKCGRRYLVGYVGVMGEQEGIDLLLQAVAHLVHTQARTDIHFALVGDGSALGGLQEMARHLKVDQYVSFIGRAPDQLLFEVLSTADICVNPDRVNPMNDKSTMTKILEYMALAKPIVQFDVVEGRFSAMEASLYARANDPVDFADKIETLLGDAEARFRMGQFGKNRVLTQMAWTYEVPKLLNAYKAVKA